MTEQMGNVTDPFADRLGWGRGLMCFFMAGLIGLWIASKNRETPWNAVKWCAIIFAAWFVLVFAATVSTLSLRSTLLRVVLRPPTSRPRRA